MEIILKQDVPNLGFKDDILTVKPGYATNYLIPKGLAILAVPSEKKKLAETIRQRAFKEEKVKKEAEKLADKLRDIEVKIGAKTGTSGKIFGSVNALQIAEAIKEQFDIELDRKKLWWTATRSRNLAAIPPRSTCTRKCASTSSSKW
jgi:large subunit ribosomal protein L9